MKKSLIGFVRADSLYAAPIYKILALGVLTLIIGLSGHHAKRHSSALGATGVVVQSVGYLNPSSPARVVAGVLSPVEKVTRQAEIADDEDFSDMLGDAGISDSESDAAMAALAKVYPLHQLKSGQDVTLTFDRTDSSEVFTGATFEPENTKEITIIRQPNGTFAANVKEIPVIRERIAATGEIRTSVFEAGQRAGIPHSVIAAMIRIYAHDVDFQRDVRPGDHFEILYDQAHTAQGKAVGNASIIYAAMHIGGQVKPIYRVTFADKSVDYFDAAGHSTRRALLRTPVAAAHITSGFGMRMHPLLGYSKMHKGVDFGAPVGTPIFAAGAGTVEEIGFKEGFGRYIKIRHSNNLETAYGHMSRFNPRLYRGAHVNQGEVIAYVGMSGRATGPHLHFEVHVNGEQVDPLSVKMPTGRVLEDQQLAQFKQGQTRIREEFNSLARQQQAARPITVSSLK